MITTVAKLRRLRRDAAGVAAIEFAFIVPVILTMFTGTVEYSEALTVARRVTTAASTTADLVAQVDAPVDDADLAAVADIGQAIIGTQTAGTFGFRVTQVWNDAGTKKVDWTYSEGTVPALSSGELSALPNTVIPEGSYLIVAAVQYTYTPMLGIMITGSQTQTDTYYLTPRYDRVVKE